MLDHSKNFNAFDLFNDSGCETEKVPGDSFLFLLTCDMRGYTGNHEIETPPDMEWLKEYNRHGNTLPNIVNLGPSACLETNYSFDFKNTHFVILNQYCTDSCDDCSSGDVPDMLYDCLNQFPENRDRFVSLLQAHHVNAYIFGHTHNYSIVKINEFWHIDAGHSRGTGDMGARSTFVKIDVNGKQLEYETYRINYGQNEYEMTEREHLN